MSYYFTFDADGVLNGRYCTEINGGDIPSDAVEVEVDVFNRSIEETDGVWKRDPKTKKIGKHPHAKPKPTVPEQVSRAQGKIALITAGLWPDVLAHVEAMTDPTEKALAEVALNDTTHWRRDSSTMQTIAKAVGVSEKQMDVLFTEASKIAL